MHRSKGLYAVFNSSLVYMLTQEILGARSFRQFLAEEIIQAPPGGSVLDIGCGTAEIAEYLGKVDYVGFDSNPDYIEKARGRFPEAKFTCADLTPETLPPQEKFDRVMAVGLLHHLDDASCHSLFQVAGQCLKPRGSLVTVDCSFVENQNPLGRWLTSRDRGQNVRDPQGYEGLARKFFDQVEVQVVTGKLRIPYTHTILRCKKPSMG